MANLFESLKNLLAAAATNPIENLQAAVERIILYSRYFLVVICIGLAFALGIYAIAFIFEVVHVAELALSPPTQTNGEFSLVMPILELIDGALVSGLIVMVMLSTYENFVGRFGDEALHDSPEWLRRLNPGSLKVKVATALLTISAVKLLQVFMDREQFTDNDIFWKVIIHLIFIASAISLAFLDRITEHSKSTPPSKDGH
ncbi:MAG: YqhA family protein [Alphaproteobacteria bacterium]|nr:YqhA family protein [Alphaproteobacteria bacterium]